MGFSIAELFGGSTAGAAKDAVGLIGQGLGNVMDRFGFTKKLGEAEKIDKTIELIKATTASDQNDVEDLQSAREMAMVQMRTQPASWVVRQLNGALRPIAGWFSLLCLTDDWWGQIFAQLFTAFQWTPIKPDIATELCLSGILGFFFGFRQRAKEKSVSNFT